VDIGSLIALLTRVERGETVTEDASLIIVALREAYATGYSIGYQHAEEAHRFPAQTIGEFKDEVRRMASMCDGIVTEVGLSGGGDFPYALNLRVGFPIGFRP
jgi:hypothetical protein